MPENSLQTLQKDFSQHPFVTPETKTIKDKALQVVHQVEANLAKEGKNVKLAIVPYGSVGVGLAEKDSDFDGKVFFESDEISQSHLQLEFHKVSGRDYQHVKIVKFSETLESHLDPQIVSELQTQPKDSQAYEAALKDLGEIALIFGPVVGMEDESTSEIVTNMRRQFITKLLTDYPDQGEAIWGHVCEYLRRTYVEYENQTVGESEKRPERLHSAIDQKLRQRFGDNGEKTARAKKFIQHRRKNFQFPSLSTVKAELGFIESSPK